MKLRIKDMEFDSEHGELLIEDLEAMDALGITEGSKMNVRQIRGMAYQFFRRQHPEISEQDIASLPANRLKEVADFVTDFFSRSNAAAGDAGSGPNYSTCSATSTGGPLIP